ncbi:MAG: hypothetical protein JW876_06770 [Candidatus Krumholzibacteriota bacterium]|nr:hypothetical protein [Candidatus Krumholzibacteriota bacterium]
MRRTIVVTMLAGLVLLAGCKPKHPAEISADPSFDINDVEGILVAPTISSITEGEDPDRESERIVNTVLRDLIVSRDDLVIVAGEKLRIALHRYGLEENWERFESQWASTHTVDADLLRAIEKDLNVDLILLPHVYLWFKDEADYRESGTASTTQVGVTLSLVDPATGTILWEATDENYKEAIRTEGERVTASSGGWDRRIEGRTATGRDMYAAPPFEDVAILVVEVLVNSIPRKGAFGQ